MVANCLFFLCDYNRVTNNHFSQFSCLFKNFAHVPVYFECAEPEKLSSKSIKVVHIGIGSPQTGVFEVAIHQTSTGE